MAAEKTTSEIVCSECQELKALKYFLPGHKMCLACEQDKNMNERIRNNRRCESCDD